MIRFTYSAQMIDFLKSTYKLRGVTDTTAMFNAEFNTDKTVEQIKAALNNHKIRCGRTTGEIRKGVIKSFTPEEAAFIRKGYQKWQVDELTAMFNAEFNTDKTAEQIRAFTRNHGVLSGRTGQFKKDHSTWNAGKKGWNAGGRSAETRFKKGHQCNDLKPIGTTRVCSKDGYLMVKVSNPNKWRLMHLVEWEKHNGPVPKGSRIWFKDNDRTNYHIDNLMLITRAQGCIINKQGMGTVPAECKTAAVLLADITMLLNERAV